MLAKTKYQDIISKIFKLNKKIRFIAIISDNGKILVSEMNLDKQSLLKQNIQIRKGYPPLSFQPMFREVERTGLTYSEEIAKRIVWL